MCGGSDKTDSAPKPVPYNGTYTPPNLKDVYSQFRETGNVPYSYYGNGAPTKEGELDAVRASYPGAFVDGPPLPAQTPPRGKPSFSPFNILMDAISGHPQSRADIHSQVGDTVDYYKNRMNRK